jgi:hypothetical protein
MGGHGAATRDVTPKPWAAWALVPQDPANRASVPGSCRICAGASRGTGRVTAAVKPAAVRGYARSTAGPGPQVVRG